MLATEKLAFISLLPGQEEAQELVDELMVLRAESAEESALLLVPPVRGLEFFANDGVQEALGVWLKTFVPRGTRSIFLLRHEIGLAAWLEGVEGSVIVAIGQNHDPSDYEGIEGVTVVKGRNVDTLVEAITEIWPAVFPTDLASQGEEEQRLLDQLRNYSSMPDEEFNAQFGGQEGSEGEAEGGPEEESEEAEPVAVGPNPRQRAPGGGVRRQGGPGGRKQGGGGGLPASWEGRQRGGQGGARPEPPPEPDPPKASNPWLLFLGNEQLERRHREMEAVMFPARTVPAKASGRGQSQPKPPKPPKPPKMSNAATVPTPVPPSLATPVPPSLATPEPPPVSRAGGGIKMPAVSKIDLGAMLTGLLGGRGRGGGGAASINVMPEELAHLVTARGNLIVVVASRKGGVGKTTHAAAVALIFSVIAGSIGGRAAFVDFNVTNPDAWGQLGLPEGAATVRSTIAKLVAGVPLNALPDPAFAKRSQLACYPSDRSPAGYSQTEIDRFAEHLKRRYKIVVVDLANHMPEVGDPAGEAVAYWLEHADVLVLPTTASAASFTGVLDYLDLPDLPPAVVAYIVSPLKKTQQHPLNRGYLDDIRGKVESIVEFPFSSEVDFADYEETPITELTPKLRQAYWRLAEAIIKAPPRLAREDEDE